MIIFREWKKEEGIGVLSCGFFCTECFVAAPLAVLTTVLRDYTPQDYEQEYLMGLLFVMKEKVRKNTPCSHMEEIDKVPTEGLRRLLDNDKV